MVKATFKQDEYGSKLSQSIKLMDTHSQRFKDVAAECAYQTQTSTLDEVRSLKSRTKANDRSIMQQIEYSRSEAKLQHLDTTNTLKGESEAHRRRIQHLLKEVNQLKYDQAKVYKLLKSKYMIARPNFRNDTRSGPRNRDCTCFDQISLTRLTSESPTSLMSREPVRCWDFNVSK